MTEHDPAERLFAEEHLLNCRTGLVRVAVSSGNLIPLTLPLSEGKYLYGVGFRESDFQTVVARANGIIMGKRCAPVDTTALPAGL